MERLFHPSGNPGPSQTPITKSGELPTPTSRTGILLSTDWPHKSPADPLAQHAQRGMALNPSLPAAGPQLRTAILPKSIQRVSLHERREVTYNASPRQKTLGGHQLVSPPIDAHQSTAKLTRSKPTTRSPRGEKTQRTSHLSIDSAQTS